MARNFDWATYRTTPQSFKTEYLSQCSKTKIDPYTLELAKHICNNYLIPQSRKQDRAQAVERSSIANIEADRKPDLGDSLYYLLKLVRTLADSDAGLSFLCICNVLGNYYPVESTVKIFAELVKESAVPEDLVPTVQAWESLRPLFESLQGPPVFKGLVDKYAALGNRCDQNEVESTGRRELQHGSASSIVGSLIGMSRLTKGTIYEGVKSENRIAWLPDITSCAGLDAGWKTAVAEWLFGLKVELRGRWPEDLSEETHAKEKVLYSNCAEGEKSRMIVRFAPPGRPVDGVPVVWTPLQVKDRKLK
jgi:hypothetical protein